MQKETILWCYQVAIGICRNADFHNLFTIMLCYQLLFAEVQIFYNFQYLSSSEIELHVAPPWSYLQ